MVYNYKGKKACQLNEFAEDFQLIDTNKLGTPTLQSPVSQDRIALLHKALVFGIRDYFEKNGFQKAILGLSGGIDSAVVAALAAEALGSTKCYGTFNAFMLFHRTFGSRRISAGRKYRNAP